MSDIVVLFGMIIVLIIFWVISTYKVLVDKDELCRSNLSKVGVAQEACWDTLSQLNHVIKAYGCLEAQTLERVIQSRKAINTDFTSMSSILEQERQYYNVYKTINVCLVGNIQLQEQLQAQVQAANIINNCITELSRLNATVADCKRQYNMYVKDYNCMVRDFPMKFVASAFGFKERKYMTTEIGLKTMRQR